MKIIYSNSNSSHEPNAWRDMAIPISISIDYNFDSNSNFNSSYESKALKCKKKIIFFRF